MIASFCKRRAINRFVRQLGPVLKRRFGRKRQYSTKEVQRAGREIDAPTDHFCYAYCIYCSREDFDHHHRETGEQCNYDSMRAEVAELQFGGDTSFDGATAIDHATPHHESGGDSFDSGHSHADDGGHDFGDCDAGGSSD